MCFTQKMVIFQMFYFIKKENTNNKTNQQCFFKAIMNFFHHTHRYYSFVTYKAFVPNLIFFCLVNFWLFYGYFFQIGARAKIIKKWPEIRQMSYFGGCPLL